ncbi:pyridoxal-phosphate dependent enzyme [Treponema pectinovorum]|uniref:pyridoxal-phosphate dependent enzyme n=1 Tax=Treponema pectinovorum TaxID=164 RepID=UPI0011C82837|nr:pyridoxal-phosphate dependent enzyme [Treponema pectinovorum]
MKFVSTRGQKQPVDFKKAILDCLPSDGGLYVPFVEADLRRWILYCDSNTSFANIAGTLTSACINDEFSPIICETIASKAFTFVPELKKIDERLYSLKLYNTPTGSHKDFGISYLVNCIETIHSLEGGFSTFLDASIGELGVSLARSLVGKKYVKAVLVYPKGFVRGIEEKDCIWNGGNILPIEVDGTEADCHAIVRKIFDDRNLVEKYRLTVANTANIGRLMPQMFFYPYAFTRLKKEVHSDIYYAMPCGNYSNLVAGLYTWKLSLPVSGFICPATASLGVDPMDICTIPDDIVPFEKRYAADPASPSNLERLEYIFNRNSLMLKNFIFPANVSEVEAEDACRELYMKYSIFADKSTSSAYAAIKKRNEMLCEDESQAVLIERDDPALSLEYVRHATGICPEVKENVANALKKTELKHAFIKNPQEVIELMQKFL